MSVCHLYSVSLSHTLVSLRLPGAAGGGGGVEDDFSSFGLGAAGLSSFGFCCGGAGVCACFGGVVGSDAFASSFASSLLGGGGALSSFGADAADEEPGIDELVFT